MLIDKLTFDPGSNALGAVRCHMELDDELQLIDGVYYLDSRHYLPSTLTIFGSELTCLVPTSWHGVLKDGESFYFFDNFTCTKDFGRLSTAMSTSMSGVTYSRSSCMMWDFEINGVILKRACPDPFFWDQPLSPEWVKELVSMVK